MQQRVDRARGAWKDTVVRMSDGELIGLLADLQLAETELGDRTDEEAQRGRAVVQEIRETATRELALRRRAGVRKELAVGGFSREQTRRLRQAVRERVDLVALVREDVPDLRRSGKSWRGRCPFHDDREPSLVVWSNGSWRCFGCGLGGDAVAWVMAMRKFDFREALVYCAMRAGLPATATITWPQANQSSRKQKGGRQK